MKKKVHRQCRNKRLTRTALCGETCTPTVTKIKEVTCKRCLMLWIYNQHQKVEEMMKMNLDQKLEIVETSK